MVNDPGHLLIFYGLASLSSGFPPDLIHNVVEFLLELDLVLSSFDTNLGDTVFASRQFLVDHPQEFLHKIRKYYWLLLVALAILPSDELSQPGFELNKFVSTVIECQCFFVKMATLVVLGKHGAQEEI